MKSGEFIKILEKKLQGLPERDKNKILFYYDDLIFGAVESGITEDEAIANLGNIEEIVEKIMENNNFSIEKPSSDKSKHEIINTPRGFGRKNICVPIKNFKTLNVVTTSSNILLEKHFEEDLKIKHFNTFFSKLSLSIRDNTLYIIEKSKRIYTYFIQTLICILLALIIDIVFIKDPFTSWLGWTVLIISFSVIQGIFNLLLLFLKVDKTIIYIPENKLFNLNINGRYGNYKAKEITFMNVYASITSGNIKFIDSNVETIYFRASSGSIRLLNNELEAAKEVKEITTLASSGSIKIVNFICNNLVSRCKSGSIKLRKINCKNKIDASANSGSIKGLEINSKNIIGKVKSGNIKFKELICQNNLELSSTTGSVKTVNSTFKNAIASAKSGSVKLFKINNPRIEYKLDLNARSGAVKIKEFPHNINQFIDNENNTIIADKSIKADVNTGSIKVTFLS